MNDREVVNKDLKERALLKRCPNCGKLFEVEHTRESVEKTKELVPEATMVPQTIVHGATPIEVPDALMSHPSTGHLVVVEQDKYTESYVCKHCGHAWNERQEKTKELGGIPTAGPEL
jgi:predicted RNA-binding Zn-ribbon protein involved in translation (DUF1610 family)